MRDHECWVYILGSITGTLYVGFTGDLQRRVYEHKHKLVPGFTAQHGIDRLLYFESCPSALKAIEHEKRIKKWSRAKKVRLIETTNPSWRDLSAEWYEKETAGPDETERMSRPADRA